MSAFTVQWTLAAHRVVFDASALYSACISSTGASRELYRLASEGRLILILCDYSIEEVRVSLRNDSHIQALSWLDISLRELPYQHAPTPSQDDVMNNLSLVPDDPKDVPYILLARDTNADCIVSFDNDLLSLGQVVFENHQIPILRPGQFLQMIRPTFQ